MEASPLTEKKERKETPAGTPDRKVIFSAKRKAHRGRRARIDMALL